MGKSLQLEEYRIGQMACYAGWLTVKQLGRCLQRQRESAAKGKQALRFGEIALKEGYLTQEQIDSLLKLQTIQRPPEYDKTFGGLAVRKGFVTQADVDTCLEEQKRRLLTGSRPASLGVLLVDHKMLTIEQLRDILRFQAAAGHTVPDDLRALTQRTAAPRKLGTGPLPSAASSKATAGPAKDGAPIKLVCSKCGNSLEVDEWKSEYPCPVCGANALKAPDPEEPASYRVASRRYGPAVEDGRLGWMAVMAGWMTRNQVDACLERQKWRARKTNNAPMFGEVALDKGFLTEEQVRALLRIQVIRQPAKFERTFGAVAVEMGYASQEDVDKCLRHQIHLLEQQREAPLLGLIMIEKRVLTPAQVKEILDEQAGKGQGPTAALARLNPRRKTTLIDRLRGGAKKRLSGFKRHRR